MYGTEPPAVVARPPSRLQAPGSAFSRSALISIRLWLYGAAVGCLGSEVALAWKLRASPLSPTGELITFGGPLLAAAVLLVLARRLSGQAVQRLLIECLAAVAGVVLVEVGLTWFAWIPPSRHVYHVEVARRLGVPYDTRYTSQVIADLQVRGIRAYPAYARDWLLQPSIRARIGADVYPLAQVPNSTIVECNENGRFLIWQSDELGFNNPPGLAAQGPADIAAVGSSYTLGHCVQPNESYLALLRARYPHTLNFGMGGSHVATMLATLREYVAPLKPRIVIWAMYPNAIETWELTDPIVRSYLQPDFSQHLLARQGEMEQRLRAQLVPIQADLDREAIAAAAAAERSRWRDVLKFPLLRERIVPLLKALLEKPPVPEDYTQAVRIVGMAKSLVQSWGGELVVVIIPMYDEIVAGHVAPDRRHDYVTRTLSPLGVHIIDGAGFFFTQKDPAMLFSLGVDGHLNTAGHRLLADYIAADLERNYRDRLSPAPQSH